MDTPVMEMDVEKVVEAPTADELFGQVTVVTPQPQAAEVPEPA